MIGRNTECGAWCQPCQVDVKKNDHEERNSILQNGRLGAKKSEMGCPWAIQINSGVQNSE